MRSQVRLPDPIAAVFITEQLADRQTAAPDFLREKLAIQNLAEVMSDHPDEVLPRLVKLGMEICGAHSAGISIFEPEVGQFRWHALAGELATFEGATTPRNFSPCGVCLDLAQPILMEHPERAYDWIRDAGITVPEVLLVPLTMKGAEAIGTLWLVAADTGHFNQEHARVMAELSAFTGMALRTVQTAQRLKLAVQQQETLMREMSHRIKNLFSVADSMVRMTARNAATKEELAETLSGRLHALAQANGLIRRSFGSDVAAVASLSDLVERILRPHERQPSVLEGPDLAIGEQAVNHLALIFHELATNASKYGALSHEGGRVTVTWATEAERLRMEWTESGACGVDAPKTTGFGTKLVETTIERIGGEIERDWRREGLRVGISLPLKSLRS
ncbi:two-component sensor histidine kinase [Bradyrhizobium diazoefficiens]|uniref:sensor histidine kinase n=1 Tax=Bradyrhizobium diazoefficiens TaxID=1355477 RepID=UPI00272CDEED|nr:HWE histidine kinase domain-containing protein [Bradyrhizobium diazoefficiens]WLA57530.1 HWE histidine kinase domain-containing protein [Bradyrhizobium diazoefficiens]